MASVAIIYGSRSLSDHSRDLGPANFGSVAMNTAIRQALVWYFLHMRWIVINLRRILAPECISNRETEC
jgi:hypothetical protein